ncbi:MAG: aspartate 1-decarboxylase [Pirellulaceae bacterium]
MNRFLLKSKIHRATVTEADLNYEGSVTIDAELMQAANIVEFEQVHIYDVTNGNRIITYAMIGPAGSGMICINGAAAHKVHPGDLVILATYATFSPEELSGFRPRIVQVDRNNRQRAAGTAHQATLANGAALAVEDSTAS